jgi:hypothetical protein
MKALWSPLVSQVSGSMGTLVAASNRYGSYLRFRNGPNNTLSPYWQSIRDNNLALIASWQLLTYNQKLQWSIASSMHLKSYSFGNHTTLPGYNYFLSVNNNRFLAGLSVISTPPVYGIAAMPTNVTLSPTIATQILLLDYNNALSDEYFTKIFITDPVKQGVTYYKNRLRLLTCVQSNTINDLDISAIYSARFTTPFIASDQIIVKLINFNSVPCACSEPFQQRFEVAA